MMKRLNGHLSLFIEKKICSKPDNKKTKFKAFLYEKSTDVFFFLSYNSFVKGSKL